MADGLLCGILGEEHEKPEAQAVLALYVECLIRVTGLGQRP